MNEGLTAENFWTHPFTQSLQPKGKLVLVYAWVKQSAGMPIITEDVALECGMNISEVEDYLIRFHKQGILEGVGVAV
jgi:hypothetical protein